LLPFHWRKRSQKCHLYDSGSDPASVGQDEGEEQVGVDLVSQAAHLPEIKWTSFRVGILEPRVIGLRR